MKKALNIIINRRKYRGIESELTLENGKCSLCCFTKYNCNNKCNLFNLTMNRLENIYFIESRFFCFLKKLKKYYLLFITERKKECSEQIKQININEEQIHILSSKADIQGFKDFISGQVNITQERLNKIQDIFNENPKLTSIGTPEQYSQYLDTIFPDSKVKDIVYHGSDTQFEDFLEDNLNYFGTQEIAKGYGKNIYPVLIEIKKSYYEED